MRERNSLALILGVVLLFVIALLVAVSASAMRLRKSFRNEMAQRLDLEEKISKVDREREALIRQLGVLTGEMDKTKDIVEKLEADLYKAKSEKMPQDQSGGSGGGA